METAKTGWVARIFISLLTASRPSPPGDQPSRQTDRPTSQQIIYIYLPYIYNTYILCVMYPTFLSWKVARWDSATHHHHPHLSRVTRVFGLPLSRPRVPQSKAVLIPLIYPRYVGKLFFVPSV